ncbi:diacylglycerol acyltransferase DGAT2 [Patellaria atrata CBS 101060]|uniref:O-acyltransferase n=1 Tax=Patellaria atrata CBS 101060 TaxID=1346257 RepID=A0A9P4VMJ3_9PEZI|nr:diacylglycerol acyltransferase DGAT2 [Patellaria atrata CBS 101060]
MGTLIDTAITTSNDVPNTSIEEKYAQHAESAAQNGSTQNGSTQKRSTQNGSALNGSLREIEEPKYRHVFAVHAKSRPSMLSKDAEKTPSFLGFRNLMVLVLVVSNLRLMIENFKKYGVLICIRCHDYRREDIIYGAILYFSVPCHLFAAYIIELAAAQSAKGAIARMKKASDQGQVSSSNELERAPLKTAWALIALAHGVNATLNLIIATTVVYYYIHHPGIGTLCELHAVIVWLKTCSYAFTNRDLRHALLSPPRFAPLPSIYSSCPYPRNITLRNLTYFWWAPTLVYQPVYPRTDNIRWSFVLKRALEVVILSIAIWIASAQYAAPLLLNSLDSFSTLNPLAILERLMKLSTISVFCWLAGFFALFQSFLNILAELLRFADREFYDDWWNSTSVRRYWTTWNKPVSHFMRRHIYSPLVSRGVPPSLAQILVFVFSGVLHELLVGVPTHNVIGVAFAGMVLQIPLIALTDGISKIRGMGGKVAGNVVFWVSFCLVGQPLAALLYFWAWTAKYGSVSKPYLWTRR